jgi:AmiR/NasT family two-component response regulator
VNDRGQNGAVDALEFGSVQEAAVALERMLKVTEATYERTAHLQRALDSRIVIEQAKGILSERLGVGVEDAFAVLRRAARSHRVRLRELAQRVVDEEETPAEILAAAGRST